MKLRKRLARLLRDPDITYDQDGLTSVHNADFMSDPRFVRSYEAGVATRSWGKSRIHWRMHVVLWAAEMAARLDGDFVECGSNRGGTAAAIEAHLDFPKMRRRMYLFDTFKGFEDSLLSATERARELYKKEYVEDVYEEVRARFAHAPNIIPVRGPVPASLATVDVSKIALLLIDMNNAAPEIAAANFFWDRLVVGGIVVLDDYGWKAHEEQKAAFDDFSREKRVPLLRLPTGQALMIKPPLDQS